MLHQWTSGDSRKSGRCLHRGEPGSPNGPCTGHPTQPGKHRPVAMGLPLIALVCFFLADMFCQFRWLNIRRAIVSSPLTIVRVPLPWLRLWLTMTLPATQWQLWFAHGHICRTPAPVLGSDACVGQNVGSSLNSGPF